MRENDRGRNKDIEGKNPKTMEIGAVEGLKEFNVRGIYLSS